MGLKAYEAPRLKKGAMKKLILLLAAVGVLLLAGCPQSSPPPPENETWIMPSKVEVDKFYPGARAEYPLTIHNGHDYQAEFSVAYRVPGDTSKGFATAPDAAQDWVIIADTAPVLSARETRDVLIAVEMPEGATAPEKWEFWVSVKDETQVGMIQTELACRWLVTMK